MRATAAWRRPETHPMTLHVVGSVPSPELADVLAAWRLWQQAGNLSERTITNRAATIGKLLAFTGCEPLELRPAAIISYLTRPGINETTRATYHASIRSYCQWLTRTGQRPDDPTLATPTPKRPKGVPRPIDQQRVADMLATVTGRRAHKQRAEMMILLAAYQGLRVHEIAKIRGEDLSLDSMTLFVIGKGNKPAMLPLHETVAEAARHFPRTGYLFPSYVHPGQPIVPRAVSQTLRRAMAAAGFRGKPHQLRHTYGTALVRNGVDLRTAQTLLRHESLATTAIYVEVSDKTRSAAIRGLRY